MEPSGDKLPWRHDGCFPRGVALGLDKLQDALRAAGGRWNAGVNPISNLAPVERRRWLAYAPCPDELDLKHRVAASRRWRARRLELPGHARESHDLRALAGHDFVGPARDPRDRAACAAATLAVVEVTLRMAAGDAHLGLAGTVVDMIDAQPAGSPRPVGLPPILTLEPRGGSATPPDLADGRLQVRGWRELDTVDAMKRWLVTQGPLLAVFAVHEDFYAYLNGVYHYVSGALEGGHQVAVIGFDDGGEYWIAQNSWGPAWGEDGFFRIGFGERGIDASMWGIELQGERRS